MNADVVIADAIAELFGRHVFIDNGNNRMNQYSSAPKKPILLEQLPPLVVIDKVIVESLEQALYRLVIELQGQQYYVMETATKSLTRRSIIDIQSVLSNFTIAEMFLRHQSPYDEMIGHEVSVGHNELLVPLGNYFASSTDVVRH